jgi:DNA polymerase-4
VSREASEPSILYAEVPDFYAEVERLLDPGLESKMILVGGDPGKRGKVQSASVEARARGVRAGMPMETALALCAEAMRRPTDMPRYREVHGRLDVCLRRIEPAIESVALGSVYLEAAHPGVSPEDRAEQLVAAVGSELGLPLRVGIGPTRLIARLAAMQAGQVGVLRVTARGAAVFLAPLPVTSLPRVGAKAEARLAELGAQTIGDVVALGRVVVERALGARGRAIIEMAEGRDDSRVRAVRHPRTISREATLGRAYPGTDDLSECLRRLAGALEKQLVRSGLRAGRIALRVRFTDQTHSTRSLTLGDRVDDGTILLGRALELLGRIDVGARHVHGLGLTVAGLAAAGRIDAQLELFRDPAG